MRLGCTSLSPEFSFCRLPAEGVRPSGWGERGKLAKHWGGSSRSLGLGKGQSQQWLSVFILLGGILQKHWATHTQQPHPAIPGLYQLKRKPFLSNPRKRTGLEVSVMHWCRDDSGWALTCLETENTVIPSLWCFITREGPPVHSTWASLTHPG